MSECGTNIARNPGPDIVGRGGTGVFFLRPERPEVVGGWGESSPKGLIFFKKSTFLAPNVAY